MTLLEQQLEASLEQRLLALEHQRHRLLEIRERRIANANNEIRLANKEFDRDCIPLARKINKLRDQIDAEQPAEKPTERKAPTARKVSTGHHDPEWSQEDIDHYHELLNRRSARSDG